MDCNDDWKCYESVGNDVSDKLTLWDVGSGDLFVKWTVLINARMTMKSLKYSEREMEGFSPVPPPLPRRQPLRNIYAEPFVDPR